MIEPLETYRATVFPWVCDQFGHMSARWYAVYFDDACFQLYQMCGISYQRQQSEHGVISVLAQLTINYVHELVAGDLLVVRSGFVHAGNKSVRRLSRMYHADSGELCATEHATDVFFDETTRKSAPMPDAVRAAIEAHLIEDDTNHG